MSDTEDQCRGFGHRSPYKHAWCVAILSFPLVCFLFGPSAEGQSSGGNVLFLFSTAKYSDEALGVIEPSMRARFPHQITFYHAYLDDPQVEEKPYRESLAETLRRRYAGVKMDVVIACNPPALNFAREYRGKVFHDAPIVFFGVGEIEMAGQKNWSA